MLCVIAKIDRSARARLSWIQSFAASFGIVPKPIYGHITLAALDGDRDAAIAACKSALAGQGAFTVNFRTVEVLLREEKTIAAVAAQEGTLEDVHAKLAPGEKEWLPHTALLQEDLLDLNWVRSAMAQMFEPFTARVERIEFMEDNEILDGIDLRGEDV